LLESFDFLSLLLAFLSSRLGSVSGCLEILSQLIKLLGFACQFCLEIFHTFAKDGLCLLGLRKLFLKLGTFGNERSIFLFEFCLVFLSILDGLAQSLDFRLLLLVFFLAFRAFILDLGIQLR
jgi:hypothetical protein